MMSTSTYENKICKHSKKCMTFRTWSYWYCLQLCSIWKSQRHSRGVCARRCTNAGQKCSSKFQRIKKGMAGGCEEVKRNSKRSISLSIVCCRFHRKGEFQAGCAENNGVQLCGNLIFPEKTHLEEKLLPPLLFYAVPQWSEWPHGSLKCHLPVSVVWKSG